MEAVEDRVELNCSSMGLLWKKQGIYVISFILFGLNSGYVRNDGVLAREQGAWRYGNQLYTPFAERAFCQWGSTKVKDSGTLVGRFSLIHPGHCRVQVGEYTQ